MSLLQRQLGIGNACTFQLIEKNVTSLLPKSKEQLKDDAKTSLNDLLRYHPKTWTRFYQSTPIGIMVSIEAGLHQPSVSDAGHIGTWMTCCTGHMEETSLQPRKQ